MKNKFIAAIGLGACAACCAGAIALPWAIGAGFLGLASGSAIGASLEILAVLAAVIATGTIAVFLYKRQKAKANACSTDGSCGCTPSQ